MDPLAAPMTDPERVDVESFLSTLRSYRDGTLFGTMTAAVVAPWVLIAGGTSTRVVASWAVAWVVFGLLQRVVAGQLLACALRDQMARWLPMDGLFVSVGVFIGVLPLLLPVKVNGEINPIWFAVLVLCAGTVATNILLGSGRVRCFFEVSVPIMIGVALSGLRIGGFANVMSFGGLAYLGVLWVNAKQSGEWFLASVHVRLENERLVQQLLEKNSELFAQSETDPLTGAANRLGMQRFLANTDPSVSIGVVCVDLDEFKHINDVHGHGAGDAVLVATAQRLRSSFREEDLLVRLGGDEFLVVVRSPSVGIFNGLPTRVRSNVETALDVGHDRVVPRISIGTALVEGSHDLELALSVADRRLYVDKANRRIAVEAARELDSVASGRVDLNCARPVLRFDSVDSVLDGVPHEVGATGKL